MKETVFLSGLPRSGSTLLSNLLAMHPLIQSTPSSPLCNIVQQMRRTWSDDVFFKAQLDHDFYKVNERLIRTTKAVIEAWGNEENNNSIVIDKNRGWLFCLEWLRAIYPNFKIIVTIRELRNVYASIEKRHRQTLLIDFPDHMEHNLIDNRANTIFSDGGIVGSCLKAINNIGDIPDITQNIMIFRYEDLIDNPQETMDKTFYFLNLQPIEIDFNNIIQTTYESDSLYNMKYPHTIKPNLERSTDFSESKISPRILMEIVNRHKWYYEAYYPEYNQLPKKENPPVSSLADQSLELQDEKTKILINELEVAIKKETR